MDMDRLCEDLATTQAEVIKVLFMKGIAVQMGQVLDKETVIAVAEAQGVEWIDEQEKGVEDAARKTTSFYEDEDDDDLEDRPPVVTIMGHVDHGKTSLLDYIRKSKVAAGEAGGITQAIGAYQVSTYVNDEERNITFLDTPGHEAFSAMRARGARVTDIAIVVVAADDGVRPQTKEAVSHARAAGVPLIIAVNKMDKEAANPDRVRDELAALEVVCEEWGGDVPFIPVSAKTGMGIETLLETVALTAEVEELVANPASNARGTVVEAYLDKQRGAIATLLVQNGTLRMGDAVLVGSNWGKVRAIQDAYGNKLEEAGPSTPVQIMGLGGVPMAGEEFDVTDTENEARDIAAERASKERINTIEGNTVSLSNLAAAKDDEDGVQTINLIVKTDVSGSVEAVKAALGALPQDRVLLRFLHTAAGEVTESDIDLAAASEGIILAFNTTVSDKVNDRAKGARVEVRSYDVIYGLVDEVRAAMEGKLSGVKDEVFVGKAECKAVFGGGNAKVAGSLVLEGQLTMGANLRVMRKNKEMYLGKVGSLRRIKDKVKKVETGLECGVGADPEWGDWKPGDIIECFDLVDRVQTLESASDDLSKKVDEIKAAEEKAKAAAAAAAKAKLGRRGVTGTIAKGRTPTVADVEKLMLKMDVAGEQAKPAARTGFGAGPALRTNRSLAKEQESQKARDKAPSSRRPPVPVKVEKVAVGTKNFAMASSVDVTRVEGSMGKQKRTSVSAGKPAAADGIGLGITGARPVSVPGGRFRV
uniref:Translation initiation factor IF-2, chloroplastic n=1 Tax=Micromonas pusilla TaxID=38833 RepID=A0A7S0KTA0_MICPS